MSSPAGESRGLKFAARFGMALAASSTTPLRSRLSLTTDCGKTFSLSVAGFLHTISKWFGMNGFALRARPAASVLRDREGPN